MHSSSFLPAYEQRWSVFFAMYRVAPEASRPIDWKHVATQPVSLLRHHAAVFCQLKPVSVRILEVTIR